MSVFQVELPKKMRKIRKFLDLKQAEIAHEMDISTSGYSKIERGEIFHFSLARLEQFANITGLPVLNLLSKSTDELIHLIIERRNRPTTEPMR